MTSRLGVTDSARAHPFAVSEHSHRADDVKGPLQPDVERGGTLVGLGSVGGPQGGRAEGFRVETVQALDERYP